MNKYGANKALGAIEAYVILKGDDAAQQYILDMCLALQEYIDHSDIGYRHTPYFVAQEDKKVSL